MTSLVLHGDAFEGAWKQLHRATRLRIRRELWRGGPPLEGGDLAKIAAGRAYRDLQRLPFWGYGIGAATLVSSWVLVALHPDVPGVPLLITMGSLAAGLGALTMAARRLSRALVGYLEITERSRGGAASPS